MARIETIRVFLGEGEHLDQLPLAKLRRLQGWVMAESTDDKKYRTVKSRFQGARVILNGSGAGHCIAYAAEDALRGGALSVEINFRHIKTGNEGIDPILTRARHFFEQLPHDLSADSRLLLDPEDIRARLRI